MGGRKWILDAHDMMRLCLFLPLLALLAIGLLPASGCGIVADQERLVIATVGNREITRRDFRMELRNLPPQDKPIIASHADMVQAVQDYVDQEVLLLEAERLSGLGIIAVPDQAAEDRFFRQNPDIVDVREVMDPTLFMVDEAGLETMKLGIQEGIESARRDLLAEQALAYLTHEAITTGSIAITEAEYNAAFQARRDELKDFERAWVRGMLFPILPETDGLVQRVAADARRKLDQGMSVDEVMNQYMPSDNFAASPVPPQERLAFPLETDVPNDPRLPQYRGFWDDIGTAEPGDIVGPVNVQPTTRFVTGPDGRPQRETVPPSIMLVELLRYEPERPFSLDEARELLAPRIIERKVKEQLRSQHNGRVIEENLPAPATYADGQRSIMRQ